MWRGELTREEQDAITFALRDEETLTRWRKQVERANLNPWESGHVLVGRSWRETFAIIWDWFKANWPTILKILMAILPLILKEKEYANSKPLRG
jgi:hypothetical protein